MEEKQNAKVSQIDFNREWSSPYGMLYYFNIEFEDGTKGEFSTNKREQTKFEIGKDYDITIEVKTNNRGNYNKINIKKEPYQAQIVRSTAIKCAIETVIPHASFEHDLYGSLTKDYTAWLNAKGKGRQSSINAQAALSRAVLSIQNEPTLSKENILERADKYFKYISKG